MLISSTLQSVFGFERRSQMEKQNDITKQHTLELRKAKEEFSDELEAQKVADMRAKMAVARRYRSEEKFDQTVLQHRTTELQKFFATCLPISQVAIPILLEAAKNYKTLGYDSNCPLNVVLLHTRQNALKYDEICDELEKTEPALGNIVYRRWCDKDAAHNAAILNLHAIMGNIPTLVISPNFEGGMFHFNVSMWEAQSEEKPLIRPIFSIKCPSEYIAPRMKFTEEGRKAIQKRMTLISTIVSGCARDSYMLMTSGLKPTLPLYLENNPDVVRELMLPDNKELCQFMLDEYKSAQNLLSSTTCNSGLLNQADMKSLSDMAMDASNELCKLTYKSIEKK